MTVLTERQSPISAKYPAVERSSSVRLPESKSELFSQYVHEIAETQRELAS